jgi:hypothetical protein
MTFKKIRKDCLKYWKKETKRKRSINDNVRDSIECLWQNKYVSSNDMHNSIYCSIAEWNTHISDLLGDSRLDKLKFTRVKDSQSIFRFYTRVLLISSEILTDFQDFLILFEGINQKKARKLLYDNSNEFSFQELIDFINYICKHKIGHDKYQKYHFYNQHIIYHFKDSGLPCVSKKISIKNVKTIKVTGGECLEIPLLRSIIKQIVFAYSVVDNSLKNNYQTRKTELIPFERKL